ncbi:MAG: 1,2-phenylacetyl-CoA epoxidase subunit B [Planctomycetes bacterium]|nr:1,2-phenylacetyl-CoA epoxidase subunit B [Planctomycetota bacterium]
MTDTQWKVFEVFHQQARGEPHVHVGSVHAPDAEMALVLAKEQYARRQACVNLWVVPAEAIMATSYQDDDIFDKATDKSYRESWGYKTPKTISHEATEARRPEDT